MRKGLGGGDGDLGPGVGVEDGVGLPGDRRAVGVADGEDLRALFAGVAQGHQGVHGLAGLGDGDDQGALVEDRVAVAELAGQLGLAGQPGPVLDGVLGDHPGVEGGAAGDDDDLVDLAEFGVGDAHLVQGQRSLAVDPAEEGVGDGLGLVGDLLEHEGGVAALLGGGGVPVDVVLAHVRRCPVEPGDGDALAAQLDDLVLAQLDRGAGVGDEGGDVGGEEPLVLPHAHDERGVAPGADHDVRLVGVDGDEGEGPFQPPAHLPHGVREVPARRERLGQQMRDDLGVRLGLQGVAAPGQFAPQGREVLDDPVVDDGDPARVVQVGVGVGVGGRPVRRPPRVPDPGPPGRQRPVPQLLLQIDELARLLRGGEPAVREHGDTSRVVAPVFEALESCDDDVLRRLPSDITHDSAHSGTIRPEAPHARNAGAMLVPYNSLHMAHM